MEKGRPGFSLLVSSDSALLREELERQLATWQPPRPEWQRQVFWGDELPDDSFWASLNVVGLFAEYRAIILRRANELPADIWKQLSHALSRGYEHVWPFICLEVPEERGQLKIPAHIQKTRCFAFAEKQGWLWKRTCLSGANLQKFVECQAKRLKLDLHGPLLAQFCSEVPPDAQTILNELEKLALISGGAPLKENMLVSRTSGESDAFLCIRKIMAGDLEGIWSEINSATASSQLFFMIAILARDFRIFWQILSGASGQLRPYDVKNKAPVAQRLGFSGISNGFATLADTEWQVKSGRLTPEQALETMTVQLARLFAPHKFASS